LAPGHLAKLLTPLKSGKHLTMMTLGPVLGLLALKIVLVEDLDALRRVSKRIERRYGPNVRDGCIHYAIPKKDHREWAVQGGKARQASMTPAQRKRQAKRLNAIRWGIIRAQRADMQKTASNRQKKRKTAHSNGIAAKRSESARHAALMRWSPSYRAAVEDGGRQVSSSTPA
jgi:hypothetical protein